jgi:hypothetical protein
MLEVINESANEDGCISPSKTNPTKIFVWPFPVECQHLESRQFVIACVHFSFPQL